jgi:hypothetical protein
MENDILPLQDRGDLTNLGNLGERKEIKAPGTRITPEGEGEMEDIQMGMEDSMEGVKQGR